MSSISPATVTKNLKSILAQMQKAEYDSAIENIGFTIEDHFQEIIESGSLRGRNSGDDSHAAMTVEHVVLARRFIPRLRGIAQMLKRDGSAKSAIAEMERIIAEWDL